MNGKYLCVSIEIQSSTSGRHLQTGLEIMFLQTVAIDALQHTVAGNPGMDVLVLGMSAKGPVGNFTGPTGCLYRQNRSATQGQRRQVQFDQTAIAHTA